jgi:hypothetical protein
MLFELPDSAQHRQQHRRTLDGRLCAAAFVFDRQTHVGCSDGTNPAGEHGREWCYVDAQVAHASSLGVQCVCVCAVCSATAMHAVIGRWSWGACVGLLRSSISCVVLGSSALARVHFNRCHGTQSARLCLQRLVKPLRCCGMPRHARSSRVRAHIAPAGAIRFMARLAAVDYEALRLQARSVFASKIEEVRGSIATMQKAQRAAEQALDMCCSQSDCAAHAEFLVASSAAPL